MKFSFDSQTFFRIRIPAWNYTESFYFLNLIEKYE